MFAEGVETDSDAMTGSPCLDDNGEEVFVVLGGSPCPDGRQYWEASDELGWGFEGEPWATGPGLDTMAERCGE